MAYRHLLYEVSDGVATLRLNRPDAANGIDLTTARELMEATVRADEDPDVRAVLLAANGKMFSAGGDVKSFAGAGERLPSLLKELTVYLHAAVSRLARMDAPVVAAVGGPAAGAGMSLALAADFVLVSDAARFTMAYTRVGLSPDGSSTYWLPRLIGTRRTLELMMTNRTLDAGEALDWGLVNGLVDAAELESEALAFATQLAKGPTRSFGSVKRLVQASFSESLETQMEHEARAIADASRTADGREGIAAFLEKRAPKFTGR